MSASTKIFVAVLFAFVVYVAAKGELPAYLKTIIPGK